MHASQRHAKPAQARGREARLKADFAYLYPGLDSTVWTPVEALINRVVTLLYGDPANSGRITGARLLREDHFEFRGASPRPEGWPEGLTRMSDAAAPPDRELILRPLRSRRPGALLPEQPTARPPPRRGEGS